MKSIPTDPMRQHDRFMSAFCDDLLAGDYHAPRAKAVCEISRQINGDCAETRTVATHEPSPAVSALRVGVNYREADVTAHTISKTGKKRLRRTLFEKQDGLCAYCDGPMALSGCGKNMASFDHIQALDNDGADDETNLVLACWQCNRLKGSMTPDHMRKLADRIEELTQSREREAGQQSPEQQ